jgi:hypothetical protein
VKSGCLAELPRFRTCWSGGVALHESHRSGSRLPVRGSTLTVGTGASRPAGAITGKSNESISGALQGLAGRPGKGAFFILGHGHRAAKISGKP